LPSEILDPLLPDNARNLDLGGDDEASAKFTGPKILIVGESVINTATKRSSRVNFLMVAEPK